MTDTEEFVYSQKHLIVESSDEEEEEVATQCEETIPESEEESNTEISLYEFIDIVSLYKSKLTNRLVWITPQSFLKCSREAHKEQPIKYALLEKEIAPKIKDLMNLASNKSWNALKEASTGHELSTTSYGVDQLVKIVEMLVDRYHLLESAKTSSTDSKDSSEESQRKRKLQERFVQPPKRTKEDSLSAPSTRLPDSNIFTSCTTARMPIAPANVDGAVNSILRNSITGSEHRGTYPEPQEEYSTQQSICFYEDKKTTLYTREAEDCAFAVKMEIYPRHAMLSQPKDSIWRTRAKSCFVGVTQSEPKLIAHLNEVWTQIEKKLRNEEKQFEVRVQKKRSFNS